MLTSLRIQNFRSIRDASVKLGQVNLFIGPNNSGKSNFLKGMLLLAEQQAGIDTPIPYSIVSFKNSVFRKMSVRNDGLQGLPTNVFIKFEFSTPFAGFNSSHILELNPTSTSSDFLAPFNAVDAVFAASSLDEKKDVRYVQEVLALWLRDTCIYKMQPTTFQSNTAFSSAAKLASDGNNLVQFLFYLSQNHKSIFNSLESDLARCVGDLVAISTPADPDEPGKLKLKFFDQNDVGYWAEEVSEGVLYFLALLCIVHQPEPPRLLLLEEPEKGIHPRRIKEVMDFIFELAQLRGIQIILTSHSPYVVNHFADIPECISVFDREGGETVIRNAADIMAETNDALVAAGQPVIRYSDGLGEYWVSGFLGGIPL